MALCKIVQNSKDERHSLLPYVLFSSSLTCLLQGWFDHVGELGTSLECQTVRGAKLDGSDFTPSVFKNILLETKHPFGL